MKKTSVIILTIAFVLCSLILPFDALAGVQTSDIEKTQLGSTNTFYEYDAQTSTLRISGTGDTPNFTTSGMEAPWYEWRDSSISRVVVEEGVTSLGNYFLYQVGANHIELPHSLVKIGTYALAYTKSTSSWDLPFGLKTIGSYAFYNDDNITRIKIPDTVTTISSRAFQNCRGLTSIVIPYSVKSLGTYAFYGCSSLESVTFQSMTATVSIGSYCFLGCTALDNASFPMNAALNSNCFGYDTKTSKNSSAVMNVYADSSAQSYALANGFSYNVISSIPMQCGVYYDNTYTDDNMDNVYCFEFTPTVSEVYNIYSSGDCDTYAELKDIQGNTVAQSDDISNVNRSFLISTALNSGQKYRLYVGSVRSTGDYTVVAYPDAIDNLDVFGGLSFTAVQGDYSGNNVCFDITDEMLSHHIVTIIFDDGFSDEIYYYNGIFDNKNIYYYNNQNDSPFTCGDNTAQIKIGNAVGDFTVSIAHSYESEAVQYTADADGYTVNTCMLCSDEYKDEFVPTPAITISGVAYMCENRLGDFSNHTPYTHFKVVVDGREYPVGADGRWYFNTLSSCTAVLENQYGENVEISVDFEDGSSDIGAVVMQGYDFNGDGHINGKDYVIYVKRLKTPYGIEYVKYFARNIR